MEDKRKVWITGCTRGLGAALAREFSRLGWRVAGCGRNARAMEALARELPPDARLETCDVTRDEQVGVWVRGLLAHMGAPDLVLNNAAVINASAALWEVPVEEFDQVIDINIKGVANVMRHVLPPMLEKGGGVVVNFSSGWGRSTSAEVAPYCATKFAVEGLSQAAAQETAGKVAVIPVNPGIIDTEMLRSCFGPAAGEYDNATQWAKRAVPFFAGLSVCDNGRSLSVP